MWGGSMNQRFFPAIVYGLRAQPAASIEPEATEIARCRSDDAAVGASIPIPCDVPPAITMIQPSARQRRCR